eukprot:TRINITY_DN5160_c1_g1_i1.p2 TRINITY_DN5160_c1_g1~~TRINITY_DN5160_c1_g1_i1.p2  ORF type:complete len:294 (+),score=72.23 TRINITY_DN5160_c1_g1_i1:77-958(+)
MMELRHTVSLMIGGTTVCAAYCCWGGGEAGKRAVLRAPGENERLSPGWWEERWSGGQTAWKRGDDEAAWQKALKFCEDELHLPAAPLSAPAQGARALVPLCGDSGVVSFLARQGYSVTAVDWSRIALDRLRQSLAGLDPAAAARVRIVQDDFLRAALPEGGFDLVYDRRGLCSVDPVQQGAYAAAVAAATRADGGVVYVEGRYRPESYSGKQQGGLPPSAVPVTRHVRVPNRDCGPPYHCPPSLLRSLFPGDSWEVTAPASDAAVPGAEQDTAHVPYPAALRRRAARTAASAV